MLVEKQVEKKVNLMLFVSLRTFYKERKKKCNMETKAVEGLGKI